MPHTAFRPDVEGFAFINSWQLTPTQEKALLDAIETAATTALSMLGPIGYAARALGATGRLRTLVAAATPDVYGLCGGMAFAALDYYRVNRALPRGFGEWDHPAPESELRRYLTRRLGDSLRANGPTFLAWMVMLHVVPSGFPFNGGPGWLLRRSREEWSALKRRIDTGDPWPLGLVGATNDPFLNHQVLATGYDDTATGGVITVYDMNCPGAQRRIALDLRGPTLRAGLTCGAPYEPLLGFFCESYEPVSEGLPGS